jgi:hypothetical protein
MEGVASHGGIRQNLDLDVARCSLISVRSKGKSISKQSRFVFGKGEAYLERRDWVELRT